MSVDQLRPEVRQVAEAAEFSALLYVEENEPTIEGLLEAVPDFMAVYCETAALFAADWYNSLDRESRFFARPHPEIAPQRLEATAKWVMAGPQTPANRIRSAAFGMVFDAARHTVIRNAEIEGVAITRHEHADACNRCVARASMSPKAKNSSSEDTNTVFHHHCEGMIVPVRTGIWAPPDHTKSWRDRVGEARRAGNTNPDDIAKWLDAH